MAERWRNEERGRWDDDHSDRAYGAEFQNRYEGSGSRNRSSARRDDERDTYGRGAYAGPPYGAGAGRGDYGYTGDRNFGRGYGRDDDSYARGSYGYGRGGYTGGSDAGGDYGYGNRGMTGRSQDHGSGYYGYRDESGYRRRDRDWMDRAGDEVASWFGDDDAERRRRRDEMRDDEDRRGSYYRTGGSRYRDDW